MKKIKQFRYYGELPDNPRVALNYPKGLKYADLSASGNNNIFKELGVVTHLGIQAPSGTQFYLNNSSYSIRVGSTGIYELDLTGIGSITSIRFSKDSLNAIETWTDGLIIDVLYEEATNL